MRLRSRSLRRGHAHGVAAASRRVPSLATARRPAGRGELMAPNGSTRTWRSATKTTSCSCATCSAGRLTAYLRTAHRRRPSALRATTPSHARAAGEQGFNPLLASYGPALVDRAILDALCRAMGASFYEAMRTNRVGMGPDHQQFAGLELPAFLSALQPAQQIHARHTVGLVDAITEADQAERVGDGLPETLEEVVQVYGTAIQAEGDAARWMRTSSSAGDRIGDDRLPEPTSPHRWQAVRGTRRRQETGERHPGPAGDCPPVDRSFHEQPIARISRCRSTWRGGLRKPVM